VNCRQAAEELSRAQDEPAGGFWLRVHLAGCRDCRRFRHQLAVLADASLPAPEDGVGDERLSDSARSRIAAALAETPDES
jgi:hypothetical protein